jgi:hypothetical protein
MVHQKTNKLATGVSSSSKYSYFNHC